ncbi:MAG: MYG1 family protein [Deltaproteobacteria bacterium]|nr:MYG1 family protein [Deltaproteobacteria bacterium]
MNLTRIVTHPGGAHKDDFLAVCVLMAKSGAPVVRRDPTPEELNDSQVAIVDVGGEHAALRMNFDHHHFPREHAPTCSISLVLQHYGLYEDALLFCPWLEPAEWFDSRGPNHTAKWLGIDRESLAKLNSPIDITLLRRFAACTSLQVGNPLYEVMRFIGEDMVSYLENVRQQINFMNEHASIWRLDVPGGVIEAVYLPRTEIPVDEPSNAVAAYIRAAKLEKRIAAMVYPDRRGNGFGIGRYEDHASLDFSRVQDEPDVHFAHKSGFMCKTSATEPDRLRALIRAACRLSTQQ